MGGKKKSTPLALALRLLYYRDRTKRAMEDKLVEKGLCEKEITPVLAKLTEEGLLDDERFARDLASSRVRNKNWGPRKIFMDLVRKGVPKDISEMVISTLDSESVELAAKRALEKWSARKGLSLTEGLGTLDFNKAYSHLESRGFNGELIVRLLHGARQQTKGFTTDYEQ